MRTRKYVQAMATPAFAYYEGGVHFEIVETIDRQAKPFIVRIRGKAWIPVNVIVFGDNEEHARQRIIDQLKQVKADTDSEFSHDRATKYLEGLESGSLKIESEPFPIQTISQIQWAANGGCT